MKYFKIVDKISGEEHYISSDLPSASIYQIGKHLPAPKECDMEEISYNEFYAEIEKIFEEET